MRPKLRAVTSVAATPRGIVFRLGDQFLEIKGKNSWPWFRRVEGLLNGAVTLERAQDLLKPPEYTLFLQTVEALRRAGMLYDATEDGAEALPAALASRYAATLRVIEAHTAHPLQSFADARSSKLFVAGTQARYVLPLLESFEEAGLEPYVVELSDTATASKPSFDDALMMATPSDVLVVAGSEPSDAVLARWSTDVGRAKRGPLFGLAVYEDVAVAAALAPTPAMGCLSCLAAYYCAADHASPRSSDADVDRGLRIASRLMVQQVLDHLTGVSSRRESSRVWEVNLLSFEVCQRPLFSHSRCRRCAVTATIVDCADLPRAQTAARSDARQLWKAAESFYVDAKLGLISQISEGRLLQFPYHQSAAKLHTTCMPLTPQWITDAGSNVYEARLAVLCRALEGRLSGHLQSRGVVASASTPEEALENAALQAVAQRAQEMPSDWQDVPRSAIESEAGNDMVLVYFRDRNLLSDITAQRSIALEDVEVIRFARRSNVICIVAGNQRDRVWKAGLRDLWLDLTGEEVFGAVWHTWRAVRYRACGIVPSTNLQHRLERRGLALHVRTLSSSITAGVAPVAFAHAFILEKECHGEPVQVSRRIA